MELTDAARKLLAEKGFDPTFGARPLGRVIEETVKRPLTDELLFGSLENGGTATVDVGGGGDRDAVCGDGDRAGGERPGMNARARQRPQRVSPP